MNERDNGDRTIDDAALMEAFRLMFLETRPTAEEITSARDTLVRSSSNEFTTIALRMLVAAEIKPRRKTIATTRTKWLFNRGPTVEAWEFAAMAGARGLGKVRGWWLCTDGSWLSAVGVGSLTLVSTESYARTDFGRAERIELIDIRTRRLQTWLQRPKKPVNPGVV